MSMFRFNFPFLERWRKPTCHDIAPLSPHEECDDALNVLETTKLEFSSLPSEIITSVTAYLSPEHMASLSLSSKRFSELLFPQILPRLRTDSHARLSFLWLLEDDLPNMLTCATCVMLYSWKTSAKYPPYSCPRRNISDHPHGTDLCPGHVPDRMTLEVRDLVLRAHNKGPEYGLPLSFLEHACNDRNKFRDKLDIRKTFRPRIVGGSLMLHRVDELRIDKRIPALPQLERLEVRICDHVSDANIQGIVLCALSHIMEDSSSSATAFPVPEKKCQMPHYCKLCATDLNVHLVPEETTITVWIEAWQDFGHRNCPEGARTRHFARVGSRWAYRHCHEAEERDLALRFGTGGSEIAPSLGGPERHSAAEKHRYNIDLWDVWLDSRLSYGFTTPELRFSGTVAGARDAFRLRTTWERLP